jgi:hypothetical protein
MVAVTFRRRRKEPTATASIQRVLESRRREERGI